ncbi:hypothetical protein [Micromonospora carbonacea]|uniref:DUF3558 domain-containing protein n=1 Tax=Micromonospora carbonacea TaxID=47853 RepID=A0A7H8XMB5_9ACTN|nr:hypothetical protein [Micromonospora carbonacea]MBB5827228.1 hypothetical protein [Micromonospora carbonacea]QLD24982.1 hypothetical protein HXZ27_12815 [Micromonospora carbonacea]
MSRRTYPPARPPRPARARRLAPVLLLALLAPAACGRLAGPLSADPGDAADRPAPVATQPGGAAAPTAARDGGAADPTDGQPPGPGDDALGLPDPCALVRKAEAEQLAGRGLDDGRPVGDTCTYTAPVDGPTAQVEVFVGEGAKTYLDTERALGHETRALSGVGDEAYATDDSFFVNASGRWVAVRLVRLNAPEANREPLEALARAVAGRL